MLKIAWLHINHSSGEVCLTLPRSSSFVIMTIVCERCSQIIRQKSPNVSGKGPCAYQQTPFNSLSAIIYHEKNQSLI